MVGGRGGGTTTERIVQTGGGRELTPEERALLGIELNLRRGLVGALSGPFTQSALGLSRAIQPAGFATPAVIGIGAPQQAFLAGEFAPSAQLQGLVGQGVAQGIQAAQMARQPAIDEIVRATRQAVSTRGFDPGGVLAARELARNLTPVAQQLQSIGAGLSAGGTQQLIDIPRSLGQARAQFGEVVRQADIGQQFQRQQAELGLLGTLGGIVGGGPGTLGSIAQFSPTASTTTGTRIAPRQRTGLFK